jgi:predicted deacylase
MNTPQLAAGVIYLFCQARCRAHHHAGRRRDIDEENFNRVVRRAAERITTPAAAEIFVECTL